MPVKAYFKKLQTLTLAVVTVIFIVAGVFVMFADKWDVSQENAFVFLFAAFILVVAANIFIRFFMPAMFRKAGEKPSLEEKLKAYRNPFIIRLALLELPAVFGLITFVVSAEYILLLIPAICLFTILLYWPTKARVAQELKLSEAEIHEILDQEAAMASRSNT